MRLTRRPDRQHLKILKDFCFGYEASQLEIVNAADFLDWPVQLTSYQRDVVRPILFKVHSLKIFSMVYVRRP